MKPTSFQFLCAAVVLLLTAVGCKTRQAQQGPPPEQAPIPPARYGDDQPAPGQEGQPANPNQGLASAEGSGRFGYTGTEEQGGTPPRDVRDIEASSTTTAEDPDPTPAPPPPKPKPSGPPPASEMPFAKKVPGNPLVVTLPGANASLGPVSIERYDSSGNATGQPLARGTQVSIPDPNSPGKKIYFRVP
ncbi:MAG: hypothetical protein AAF236_13405 [Verrucomicrobiota bacterium]